MLFAHFLDQIVSHIDIFCRNVSHLLVFVVYIVGNSSSFITYAQTFYTDL